MSAETVQGIKRLIDRRVSELHFLTISWFGGEPLLAHKIVADVSEHVVRATSGRSDLHYVSDMTTNGYLLDLQMVDRLAGLGICDFQVSLDGPEYWHDKTRIRADNNGSFQRIWQNLLAIRDSPLPVKVLLRIHLTPSNLPSMCEFLSDIRDTFLGDGRFQVFLKPVEHLGGPNDHRMPTLSEYDRAHSLSDLEALLRRGSDDRPLYNSSGICYASEGNSLLIRANGAIGKCTVGLSDPMNNIGHVLPDGSLQIDNPRMRRWLHGWQTGDLETLRCPRSKGAADEVQAPLMQIHRLR